MFEDWRIEGAVGRGAGILRAGVRGWGVREDAIQGGGLITMWQV